MIIASINFQDKSIWHIFLISPIPVPCLIKTSNSEWDWIIVPVSCGHTESCWYVFTECLLQERVLEGQNTTWHHSADAGQSLTPNLPLCGVFSSGVLQPRVCTSQLWDACSAWHEDSIQQGINEMEQNKEQKENWQNKIPSSSVSQIQMAHSLESLLWLLSSKWQAYRKSVGGQWGTELHTQEPEQD